jgi:hypothetical protein
VAHNISVDSEDHGISVELRLDDQRQVEHITISSAKTGGLAPEIVAALLGAADMTWLLGGVTRPANPPAPVDTTQDYPPTPGQTETDDGPDEFGETDLSRDEDDAAAIASINASLKTINEQRDRAPAAAPPVSGQRRLDPVVEEGERVRDVFAEAWEGNRKPVSPAPAATFRSPGGQHIDDPANFEPLAPNGKYRRPKDEHFAATVARVGASGAALAEAYGVPEATAYNWLARARRAQII